MRLYDLERIVDAAAVVYGCHKIRASMTMSYPQGDTPGIGRSLSGLRRILDDRLD